MKIVYKCDWCDQTGTEDEILEHEKTCIHNKTLHSCFTCGNCKHKSLLEFCCKAGKQIPKGSYFEQCKTWTDGKLEPMKTDAISDLLNVLLGAKNDY